jgi:hypothetical protein
VSLRYKSQVYFSGNLSKVQIIQEIYSLNGTKISSGVKSFLGGDPIRCHLSTKLKHKINNYSYFCLKTTGEFIAIYEEELVNLELWTMFG